MNIQPIWSWRCLDTIVDGELGPNGGELETQLHAEEVSTHTTSVLYGVVVRTIVTSQSEMYSIIS